MRFFTDAMQMDAQYPQQAWKAAQDSLCACSAVGDHLQRREGHAAGDGAVPIPGECQCKVAKKPCIAIEGHHLQLYLLHPICQVLAVLQRDMQN